ALTLQPEFAWNVLAVVGMGVQCYIQGFSVMPLRKKLKVDYPDNGNGRYAAKLTDEEWLEFNNHQRAHQNYLEALPVIQSITLAAALYQPRYSAIAGGVYILARQLYANGYRKHGPKGREFGALLGAACLAVNLGIALYGSVIAT
ncbi:hypothetical protein GQ42DRAFT_114320, partial [Ramicandelaber brevisporus]